MKRKRWFQAGTPGEAWAQFDTPQDLKGYTNRSISMALDWYLKDGGTVIGIYGKMLVAEASKRKRLAAKLVWLRLNGNI